MIGGTTAMADVITTAEDRVSVVSRWASDPSSSLNWVMNRFRTVRTWREYSDPYGQGVTQLWFVASCRKCRLSERQHRAIDLAWFQVVHHHHPRKGN